MMPQNTAVRTGITVGDLCQAIGDRRIAAKRKDDEYVVRGSDIRRLERTSSTTRSLPGMRNRRPAC
jgi:hypothetical protein